jgi:hypothetical protein
MNSNYILTDYNDIDDDDDDDEFIDNKKKYDIDDDGYHKQYIDINTKKIINTKDDFFVDSYEHGFSGYKYEDEPKILEQVVISQTNNNVNISEQIEKYNLHVDKYDKHIIMMNNLFDKIIEFVKVTNTNIDNHNDIMRRVNKAHVVVNKLKIQILPHIKNLHKKLNGQEFKSISTNDAEKILPILLNAIRQISKNINDYNKFFVEINAKIQKYLIDLLKIQNKKLIGGENKFDKVASKVDEISRKIESINGVINNFDDFNDIILFSTEHQKFLDKLKTSRGKNDEKKMSNYKYHDYNNNPFITFPTETIYNSYQDITTLKNAYKSLSIGNENERENDFFNFMKKIQMENNEKIQLDGDNEFDAIIKKTAEELTNIHDYNKKLLVDKYDFEIKTAKFGPDSITKNKTGTEEIKNKIAEISGKITKNFNIIKQSDEIQIKLLIADVNGKSRINNEDDLDIIWDSKEKISEECFEYIQIAKKSIADKTIQRDQIGKQLDENKKAFTNVTKKLKDLNNLKDQQDVTLPKQKEALNKEIKEVTKKNAELLTQYNIILSEIEEEKNNITHYDNYIDTIQNLKERDKLITRQTELEAEHKEIEEEAKTLGKKQKFDAKFTQMKTEMENKITQHNSILFENLSKISELRKILNNITQPEELQEQNENTNLKTAITPTKNLEELKKIFAHKGGATNIFKNIFLYKKINKINKIFKYILTICISNKLYIYDELFKFIIFEHYEKNEITIGITYAQIIQAQENMKKCKNNYLSYTISYAQDFINKILNDKTKVFSDKNYIVLDTNKKSFAILSIILFFCE